MTDKVELSEDEMPSWWDKQLESHTDFLDEYPDYKEYLHIMTHYYSINQLPFVWLKDKPFRDQMAEEAKQIDTRICEYAQTPFEDSIELIRKKFMELNNINDFKAAFDTFRAIGYLNVEQLWKEELLQHLVAPFETQLHFEKPNQTGDHDLINFEWALMARQIVNGETHGFVRGFRPSQKDFYQGFFSDVKPNGFGINVW